MLSFRPWQIFYKKPYQDGPKPGSFCHILQVCHIAPAASKNYSVKTSKRHIVDNRPKIYYKKYASQGSPKSHLLVDDSLVEIVSGNRDPGVSIDSYGKLRITSDEKSLRNNKTALILSRASPSLTIYDFRRLLGSGMDESAGEGFEEGDSPQGLHFVADCLQNLDSLSSPSSPLFEAAKFVDSLFRVTGTS